MIEKTEVEWRLGTWMSIGTPVIAELAAWCGIDWILIDLEHGSAGADAVAGQLRALQGTSTLGVVRVPSIDPALIGRVLDLGADGIMVPHVSSAAQAEACVRAMNYPPKGQRGVSRTVRRYRYGLQALNDQPAPLLLAQIEDPGGVAEANSIAAVDGVDVLFVGPGDLQHSLDCLAAEDRPTLQACLEQVSQASANCGKACGVLCRDVGYPQQLLDLGYSWIAQHSDLAILRRVYQELVKSKAQGQGGIGKA